MEQKQFTKRQLAAIESLGKAFGVCSDLGLVFEGGQFYIHAYRRDNYDQAEINLRRRIEDGTEKLLHIDVKDYVCYIGSSDDRPLYYR